MKVEHESDDDNMENLVIRKRGHSNKNQVMGILEIHRYERGHRIPQTFLFNKSVLCRKKNEKDREKVK